MATTVQESPRKKRSVHLPDELVLQCIARVPISSHGAMSLVSKKVGNFINEGEIFNARSSLGLKDTIILVGIQTQVRGSLVDWYALSKKFCNDDYVLRRVQFPLVSGKESLVAAGKRVLVLGGASDFFSVEGVTYEKKTVPKTKATHYDPKTAVVDDKLYVFGGCSSEDALNYLEILDLNKNVWESHPIPEEDQELIPSDSHAVVWRGIVHFIWRDTCVVFDPTTRKLERKDHVSMGERMYHTSCVINDIIYTIGLNSKMEYYDSESRAWTAVRGIESLPDFDVFSTALFNFNGKVMVLHQKRPEEIWFTLIVLEKKELDIWGYVEHCNCGLSLHKPAEILRLVSLEI